MREHLREGSLRRVPAAAGPPGDMAGAWWCRAVLFYWRVRMTTLLIRNSTSSRAVNFPYILFYPDKLPQTEFDSQKVSLWSLETQTIAITEVDSNHLKLES